MLFDRSSRIALLSSTAIVTSLASFTALAGQPVLPTGGQFVAGAGTIAQSGATTTVTQTTARGVVTWQDFSIGKGGIVQVNNGSGATLNRVTGGHALLGTLNERQAQATSATPALQAGLKSTEHHLSTVVPIEADAGLYKSVSEMALAALRSSDYNYASTLYKINISLEPASVEAWNNFAICCALSGKPRKSSKYFKISRDLNGKEISIYFNYAKSLLDSEFYEMAVSAFKDCISIRFDDPLPYIGIARSLTKGGEIDAAMSYFRFAISLDPGNPLLLSEIGVALEKAGFIDRALIFYKRALAVEESNYEAKVAYLKHQVQKSELDDLKNYISIITEKNSIKMEIVSDLIKRHQLTKAGRILLDYTLNQERIAPVSHQRALKNDFILATSIAPKNLGYQYSCLCGWMNQGFELVSINTEEEISKIISTDRRFSDIEFVRAYRSADHVGKPLVYIDDMINFVATSHKPYVGIVNSDIMPSDESSEIIFEKYGENIRRGSLIYSRRTDVNLTKSGSIIDKSKFSHGFDMFFSSAGSMMTVGRSNLVFGAPWWDYWMPICYCVNGISILEIEEDVGFHVRHDVNWSEEAYKNCGIEFLNALSKLIDTPYNALIANRSSQRQLDSMKVIKNMLDGFGQLLPKGEKYSLDHLHLANVVALGAIDFYATNPSFDIRMDSDHSGA